MIQVWCHPLLDQFLPPSEFDILDRLGMKKIYPKLSRLTQILPDLPKTYQTYPKLPRVTQNLPNLPETYQTYIKTYPGSCLSYRCEILHGGSYWPPVKMLQQFFVKKCKF